MSRLTALTPAPPVTVAPIVERQITEWGDFTGQPEAVGMVEVRLTRAGFLQALDPTRLAAHDQLAQGRTDAATAYVALFRALGGNWP